MGETVGLGPGAHGDEVLKLQSALQALGLNPGVLPGVFDQSTEQSVRLLQQKHGFAVDGRVVGETRELLLGKSSAQGELVRADLKDVSVGGALPVLVDNPDWSSAADQQTQLRSDLSELIKTGSGVGDLAAEQKWMLDPRDVLIAGTIANPSFEQGREGGSIPGWYTTGDAFNNQPTYGHNVLAPRIDPSAATLGGDYWHVPIDIGHSGDWWIGTYENRPGPNHPAGGVQGDGPVGTATSDAFTVVANTLAFLVGGTASPDTRVELQVSNEDLVELRTWEEARARAAEVSLAAGQPVSYTQVVLPDLEVDGAFSVLLRASGDGSEFLRRVRWDTRLLVGCRVRLRIVDHSSSGHISCDHFVTEVFG